MSASDDTTAQCTPSLGNVHVYVDNSHLWICGQKTFAVETGFAVESDTAWRFDAGRLKAVIEENSGLQADEKAYNFQYYLHGSTPPVDTVWRPTDSHHVHLGQSPNSIHTQIATDAAFEANSASYGGVPSTFMIVSGHSTYLPIVRNIQGCGFPVHVWSWKSCLAPEYTQQQQDGSVQVHLLDDYLKELVSYETTFCVDPTIINPNSTVILDPLPEADMIEDFVSRLEAPVYQYDIVKVRPTASGQDLLIVPAYQANGCIDGFQSLLEKAQTQLQSHGLDVLGYTDYCQQYIGENTVELEISDGFKERPGGLWGAAKEDAKVYTRDDSDAGWTTVDRYSKERKRSSEGNRQRPRKRCGWRRYCRHELDCRYGHTKDEEDYFAACGHKNARKYRFCQYRDCYRGKYCFFAHNETELFCPTCDKTGVGHGIENCPES